MTRLFWFLTIFTLLLAEHSARAERIYQLVNYPDLQNGHTLSGTITTTNDAPADGLLATEEILDWEWSITGPNELQASSNPLLPFESKTLVQGIVITASMIELPDVDDSMLALSQEAAGSRGPTVYNVAWFTRFDQSKGMLSQESAGSLFEGDFLNLFWRHSFAIQDNGRVVIATAVPEPSSVLLGSACLSIYVIFIRLCY